MTEDLNLYCGTCLHRDRPSDDPVCDRCLKSEYLFPGYVKDIFPCCRTCLHGNGDMMIRPCERCNDGDGFKPKA